MASLAPDLVGHGHNCRSFQRTPTSFPAVPCRSGRSYRDCHHPLHAPGLRHRQPPARTGPHCAVAAPCPEAGQEVGAAATEGTVGRPIRGPGATAGTVGRPIPRPMTASAPSASGRPRPSNLGGTGIGPATVNRLSCRAQLADYAFRVGRAIPGSRWKALRPDLGQSSAVSGGVAL
jgi:hypothetical protein